MPKKKNARGRPPAVAPPGFVTIAAAKEERGVAYSVVRRYIAEGLVRSRQAENGELYVDARDVHKIEKHEAAPDRTRVPVQLTPNAERYASWRSAAEISGMTVTELAGKLLDKRAHYTPPE